MADPAARAAPRARRFDPDRRDLILLTTLEIITEVGTGAMTQRRVAAAADVPLGSVTYHFPTRDDLVHAAFARFVDEQNAIFGRTFGAITTREELFAATVALVDGGPGRGRAAVLGFELHLAALRDPRMRDLTAAWTAASRAVLARLLHPAAAADLDAYLEGLILHSLVSPSPVPVEETRTSIARFLQTVDDHPRRSP